MKKFLGLLFLAIGAYAVTPAGGTNKAVTENVWAGNHAILVSTGTSVATSSVTVQNLAVLQLTPNQCVQTDGNGKLTSAGANCSTPVAGGASTLQVTASGVQVTSPTKSMNFDSSVFSLSAVGSTATVTINGSSVTAQGNTFNTANKLVKLGSDGGFNVSSGTVSTSLTVGTTLYSPLINAYPSASMEFYVNNGLGDFDALSLTSNYINGTYLTFHGASSLNTSFKGVNGFSGSLSTLYIDTFLVGGTPAFNVTAGTSTNKYALVVDTATAGPYFISVTTGGAVGMSSLTASQFVKTDSSKTLVSYDLLGGNPTFTGGATFGTGAGNAVNLVNQSAINFGGNGTIHNNGGGIVVDGTPPFTFNVGATLYARTKAQIAAITPSSTFEMYGCSDCGAVRVCISTGTAVGAFSLITSSTTACQ